MKNLLLLLLVCAFFSCKKGQADIEIEGHLLDATHGVAMQNATITVYKKNAGSEENVHVTTVQSDAEGKFSFSVVRDKFVSLELVVEKNHFFTERRTINFSDLTLNSANYINFVLTGKSWARIHLKHSESSDTKLDIVRTKGKSGCDECCADGYQQFTGITDTVFYCINDANTVYEITYFKLYTTFSGTKSATTTFMDTVDIVLEY